jgi:hypothetical protein
VFSPRQLTVRTAVPLGSGEIWCCKAKQFSCQGGGVVTQLPAESRLYRPFAVSNSTPVRIRTLASSVAAIAAGKLLNPFRTQKISPSTFHTVLRCASPRELWIAATSPNFYKSVFEIDNDPLSGCHKPACCSRLSGRSYSTSSYSFSTNLKGQKSALNPRKDANRTRKTLDARMYSGGQ